MRFLKWLRGIVLQIFNLVELHFIIRDMKAKSKRLKNILNSDKEYILYKQEVLDVTGDVVITINVLLEMKTFDHISNWKEYYSDPHWLNEHIDTSLNLVMTLSENNGYFLHTNTNDYETFLWYITFKRNPDEN